MSVLHVVSVPQMVGWCNRALRDVGLPGTVVSIATAEGYKLRHEPSGFEGAYGFLGYQENTRPPEEFFRRLVKVLRKDEDEALNSYQEPHLVHL